MGRATLRSPSPLTKDTNHKTDPSSCRQRPNGRTVRFSSWSVNSGYHFSSINSELVLPPYKATSTKCEVDNNFFHGNKISAKRHSTTQIKPSWEKIMGRGSLRSPSRLTQDTDRKTDPSDCRQRPNGRSVRFSSRSVNSGYHFSSINSELVLPPYEATFILLWALRAQISQFSLLMWEANGA